MTNLKSRMTLWPSSPPVRGASKKSHCPVIDHDKFETQQSFGTHKKAAEPSARAPCQSHGAAIYSLSIHQTTYRVLKHVLLLII